LGCSYLNRMSKLSIDLSRYTRHCWGWQLRRE